MIMGSGNPAEIQALIALLEDPDREVFEHVFNKLSGMGKAVIPQLESAWEEAFDSVLQERIEELIHKIQFEGLVADLQHWVRSSTPDLLEGALIISRYQYPELDENRIRKQIETIRKEIWLELGDNLTPFEEVNVINQILYSQNGFKGNPSYQGPHYFYLNFVLDTKKGNALSLSMLYLILARQLEIPIYGVNLPHHFILAYARFLISQVDVVTLKKQDIHFYINTLNKGLIFTYQEIKEFLQKLKLTPKDEYFVPCTNVVILHTLLEQLKVTYDNSKEEEKSAEINRLIEVLSTDDSDEE